MVKAAWISSDLLQIGSVTEKEGTAIRLNKLPCFLLAGDVWDLRLEILG